MSTETPKEIADALLAAPHLTDETLEPLLAYRREKAATGAPTDLESAVVHAARECERIAEELRAYLARAIKEATEQLGYAETAGTRYGGTWFTLDGRENAENIAKRLRARREHFNALLSAWQSVADRIVATPEEAQARREEQERHALARRKADIEAWLKLDLKSLAGQAEALGVVAVGSRKADIASALVDAGHRPS